MREWSRPREAVPKAAVVPFQVAACAARLQDPPPLKKARTSTQVWLVALQSSRHFASVIFGLVTSGIGSGQPNNPAAQREFHCPLSKCLYCLVARGDPSTGGAIRLRGRRVPRGRCLPAQTSLARPMHGERAREAAVMIGHWRQSSPRQLKALPLRVVYYELVLYRPLGPIPACLRQS